MGTFAKKYFTPLQYIHPKKVRTIYAIWILAILGFWIISSFTGDTHFFPTIDRTLKSLFNIFTDPDLKFANNVISTINLSVVSITLAIVLSILIAYLSTFNAFHPLPKMVSQMRYLPFAGLTAYLSIIITSARPLQTTILVIFTSTFLVTSLLQIISDITTDEYNNAKTLGMTRWEILYEICFKSRLDYILEAIRQNLAIVTMTIVTAESFVLSNGGIGAMISRLRIRGEYADILALQIFILLTTIILDSGITYLRKSTFRFSKF